MSEKSAIKGLIDRPRARTKPTYYAPGDADTTPKKKRGRSVSPKPKTKKRSSKSKSPKTRTKKAKKDKNAPKRNISAYFFYVKENRDDVQKKTS